MAESWWGKLDRANQHLVEAEQRINALAQPNGQEARIVVSREDDGTATPWVYRVALGVTPDETLPIVVGDFLFDVRSALDHLAVALLPRKFKRKAYFPIFRNQAEEDCSEWPLWSAGFSATLKEAIRAVQPYARMSEAGADVDNHALVLLSSFHNADKHRELTVITTGVFGPALTITDTGERIPFLFSDDCGLRDGAVVLRTEHRVSMRLTGRLKVAMGRQPDGPYRELPTALERILGEATAVIRHIEAAVV